MFRIRNNKDLVLRAKKLRKEMTKEERKLWYDFLKGYPVRILRQKVIGNYIVDFYCPSAKLAIEIDGFQHDTNDKVFKNDFERTNYLSQLGIIVERINNEELKNKSFSSVCEKLDKLIKSRIKELKDKP